jgi:TolA-binding protein
MDSTLDKLAEEQITKSLEEQFSNLVTLAREEEVGPLAPPTRRKTPRAPPATIHRSAGWRYVAFLGCLLAASIGAAAWRWSSSVDTAMMAPSDPAPLTRAAPKDVAPTAVALTSEFAQQLQPMARDLAALRQTVEQLEVKQEQLVRDNENLASQLKASREEMARNNSTIDQIKATQIQMARESQTLTERLNASQEQLAHVVANASEPNVTPEAPKVSPEEPKVMPQIPLPRPRQSANVAQTQKPAPSPARPQAKKPQPSLAWPWSVHSKATE